jgi:hypothetical protein
LGERGLVDIHEESTSTTDRLSQQVIVAALLATLLNASVIEVSQGMSASLLILVD